jgi:hypothetical protein
MDRVPRAARGQTQSYFRSNERGPPTKALTSAAVARPLTSPSRDRFSADRGRRIRSTGTRAIRCRREVALGSRRPPQPGQVGRSACPIYYRFSACPKTRQFQVQERAYYRNPQSGQKERPQPRDQLEAVFAAGAMWDSRAATVIMPITCHLFQNSSVLVRYAFLNRNPSRFAGDLFLV